MAPRLAPGRPKTGDRQAAGMGRPAESLRLISRICRSQKAYACSIHHKQIEDRLRGYPLRTFEKGSAARAIFLGPAQSGAQSDISITVSEAKSGTVVFSYTCQKNGEFGRMQSAAECLAKHWTHFIQKGKL